MTPRAPSGVFSCTPTFITIRKHECFSGSAIPILIDDSSQHFVQTKLPRTDSVGPVVFLWVKEMPQHSPYYHPHGCVMSKWTLNKTTEVRQCWTIHFPLDYFLIKMLHIDNIVLWLNSKLRGWLWCVLTVFHLSARLIHRKGAGGKPDHKDLSENMAATQGLSHMIVECKKLFQVLYIIYAQSLK